MGRNSVGRANGGRTLRTRAASSVLCWMSVLLLTLGMALASAPLAAAKAGPASTARARSGRPAIALTGVLTRPSLSGRRVRYAFVATNSGSTTLWEVRVIPHETLVGFVCGGQAKAELTEGQTLTCTGTRTLTQAELDGGRVVGAATVRAVAGTAPKDPVVSAAVRAAIVVPARPALRLTKSASATSVGKAGDVVTYTFVATNTGNVTLTDVTVSDELAHLSELTCDQPAPASLAPGSALTCSAKLVVSQSVMDFGAIVNIAEVSGEAPGGDPADPSDDIVALDDARVGVNQRPRIGLSSTASPSGKVRLGHRIRYVLTVKNTGNVTLSELALTSGLKKLGRLGCSSSLSVGLAPGQVRICTASYRVSTGDAKRGKVVNSTVVTASAPYATSTSGHVTARATTSREVRPAATALKGPAAEPAPAALADTGGPAAGVGWLAVALVGAGAIVLARARRRAIQAGAR